MPRIFFYTAWSRVDPAPKAGGPKVVQQHVRILRESGRDARIVLGGKRRFFARTTPFEREHAVGASDFRKTLADDDVVVVPAVLAKSIDRIPGMRKVVMVQNGVLFFRLLDLGGSDSYPWHDPHVEALITVSDFDRELLELAHPTAPVYRTYNTVDPDRFHPRPWAERDRLVLAAPLLDYKNPWHTATICHLVRSRAAARDGADPVTVKVIQGLEPREVAELMGRARVFVFPSLCEGFALMPMEALAAGTPVITPPGLAYAEYVPEEFHAPAGDFGAWIERVERCLEAQEGDPLLDVLDAARDRILGYTADRQRASVLEAWDGILTS